MSHITAIILSMSILLPLIAGVLVINKSILLKKLIILLTVGIITEILLTVTSYIGNNLIYFNLYTIVETALIGLIYIEMIKNPTIKNLIWFFGIAIIIEGILGLRFNVIDSTTKFYESLLVIFAGIAYFFSTLSERRVNLGHLILNSGFILFYASAITIYLISENTINDPEKYKYLYEVHSYINFGVNIIFLVAILFFKKDDAKYIEDIKTKAVADYITSSQKIVTNAISESVT